ncbi:MAG: asparagine synthase (glutamine-hydrolyzing) [Planctomycetota bacterium]
MCGIAGICGPLTEDSPALVRTMSDALAHRGPDDSGAWLSPSRSAALAHRRLAIIDLSPAGRQPMSTRDGRFTVVYNGELYNFRELRAGLERQGVRLRSHSDTEVLLELWAAQGEASLDKLHGMFAFAVWDEDARTLTLARDPFGIKPLYYRVLDGRIAFASEVKALRRAHLASRVDPDGLSAFLQFGSVPAPLTFYEGVKALPPGALLRFDARKGTHSTRAYWDYSRLLARKPPPPMCREEARERVRDVLLTSAREHLTSDVPVGAFLSGGIDSTSIVSLMRQVGYPEIRTFSIGFDLPALDETAYARLAARRFGTSHSERVVTCADFQREREKVLSAMDQPSVDGVNVYFVSRFAAEAGLKVVMSGLGGDEFFQGYPYFRTIPRLLLARRALPAVLSRAAAFLLARSRGTRASRLREFLSGDRSLRGAYLACRKIRSAAAASSLVRFPAPPATSASAGFERLFDSADCPVELGKRITLLESRSYMAATLLRDSDVFSMAHGLELRLPLVYDRLAACLAGIPDRFVRPNGRPKALLADAVADLPLEILRRRKMGFTFPLDAWLRSAPPYRFCARSWDPRAVERVQADFRARKATAAEFWSLVVADHFLSELNV